MVEFSNPAWDWFDYVLHTDNTEKNFAFGMRLSELGLGYQEALRVFYSKADLDEFEYSYHPPRHFAFKREMLRLEALIAAGHSLADSIAWTRISMVEDLSVTQTVAFADLREVDPAVLLCFVDEVTLDGELSWDFGTLYRAAVHKIDLSLMDDLNSGESRDESRADYDVFIRDDDGSIDIDIKGEGIHLSEHRLPAHSSSTYLDEVSEDGTSFVIQIAKENPVDERAQRLHNECEHLIRKHTGRNRSDFSVSYRYGRDPGC